MEETTLQDIFIKILASELTEAELEEAVRVQITPDVISTLYSLSKRQDLAHIVSCSLRKHGLLTDSAMSAKFNKFELMSVYRNEQMKYAFGQICEAFDRISIPYIPLKGSVIRPYYPRETMRTSCDIDVLIKEDDLDAAISALTQKGYTCGERNYHDVSLFSEANIHLELHFNIQENIESLDSVLKDAWNYAEPVSASRYKFSDEMFIFHMFAHMSYHFLCGGCGIKALLDVWVMEHKMGLSFETAKKLLEKAGIYRFAEEMSKLSDICFMGKPKDGLSDTLLSYIFSGGVYGTSQNKIAVIKSKKTSSFMYLLKRLFPPYKTMTVRYPSLKKLPFLLPFYWIARFFGMLFGGSSKRSFAEIKTVNNISDDEINTISQIRDFLGL